MKLAQAVFARVSCGFCPVGLINRIFLLVSPTSKRAFLPQAHQALNWPIKNNCSWASISQSPSSVKASFPQLGLLSIHNGVLFDIKLGLLRVKWAGIYFIFKFLFFNQKFHFLFLFLFSFFFFKTNQIFLIRKGERVETSEESLLGLEKRQQEGGR